MMVYVVTCTEFGHQSKQVYGVYEDVEDAKRCSAYLRLTKGPMTTVEPFETHPSTKGRILTDD